MARITDGSGTTISLANGTTLWETGITPPTFEGGGAVETTTLRNSSVRTRANKTLKDLGECSFTAQYDDAHLTTLYGAVNTNQEITITFPDSSTLKFWGFIDSVSASEIVEGEAPTVDVTVISTNQDDSSPPVEKVPVFA